jgi:23S rRNA (cytidine1920-2'-O)/16S rRNA (cytidine1409-2'-O)-methyltransferase
VYRYVTDTMAYDAAKQSWKGSTEHALACSTGNCNDIHVSFISLVRVLPAIAARVREGGWIVALVKPQFEAARAQVPKGVVRSPAVHRQVLLALAGWVREQGWTIAGMTPSPLAGPKGNREFFLWLVRGGGPAVQDVEQSVTEMLREVHAGAEGAEGR